MNDGILTATQPVQSMAGGIYGLLDAPRSIPMLDTAGLHDEAIDWARRVAVNGGVVSQETLRIVIPTLSAIFKEALLIIIQALSAIFKEALRIIVPTLSAIIKEAPTLSATFKEALRIIGPTLRRR